MYESFYGLTRTPFAVTPDPAMLFMSKVHREALATIIYGIETRKGFIVCTGEVGTGKSTIVRAYFDQTLADAVKLIYIFTPQVSPLEMAKYICREMGLDEPDSIFAAVPQLQMKLLETFEAGKTVVLMIDEAQLLPPETLEFLRLLSNFETDTEKLIQIVLVGQPEVDTMLARRDMRQVNQRVALRARLSPLSVEESFEYIGHRLRVGGAADLAQVVSPSAAWLIAEAAGGIPRVINILTDNVLIAGFGAAQRPVGSQLAGAAIRDFIAKSGPAKPLATQRAGWRAAMRLKGALAREKEEPEAWVPAISPPAGRREAPAAPPPRRAETPEPPVAAKLPEQTTPPQVPAQFEPASPPVSVPEAHEAPIRLVPAASAAAPEAASPQARPAPARPPAASAPKWVDPVFIPKPVGAGVGMPVMAAGIVFVPPLKPAERVPLLIEPSEDVSAPVQPAEPPPQPVEQPNETPLPVKQAERQPFLVEPEPMPLLVEPVQYEPLPFEPDPKPASAGEPAMPGEREIPVAGHRPDVAERSRRTVFVLPRPLVAPPRPPPAANGTGPVPAAPARPAGPPAQWPALSRVRLGLPPPRSQIRGRG